MSKKLGAKIPQNSLLFLKSFIHLLSPTKDFDSFSSSNIVVFMHGGKDGHSKNDMPTPGDRK